MDLNAEQIHASAVRFLLDGGEFEAANCMLACRLNVFESGDTWHVGEEVHCAVHVEIRGPRPAFDLLNADGPVNDAVWRAINAVLPNGYYIKHKTVGAELMEIDPS